MKNKFSFSNFTVVLLIVLLFTPFASNAVATLNDGSNLSNVVDFVISYFDLAVKLIVSLCVVTFVWGVYLYFIKNADNEKAKKEGGMYVLYSLIGFFVILSMWGLVAIFTNTFGLSNKMPSVPSLSGSKSSGVLNSSGGANGYSSSGGANGTKSSGGVNGSWLMFGNSSGGANGSKSSGGTSGAFENKGTVSSGPLP